MREKRQSLFLRALLRLRTRCLVKIEYENFKRECGFAPALSEELHFKSCCARIIEEMGYVPELYSAYLTQYMRQYRNGIYRHVNKAEVH